MNSDVIAAIIAFVGALISVFISFVIALWGKRYNYHQLFAETVSQSRNKWLNEMREYISGMLANKRRMVYGNTNDDNIIDVANKYDECKFQVLIRLNTAESDRRELRVLIMQLDDLPDGKLEGVKLDTYEAIELAIVEIARNILKDEWEKVKLESKGEGEV